jgi:hypothetical protein
MSPKGKLLAAAAMQGRESRGFSPFSRLCEGKQSFDKVNLQHI